MYNELFESIIRTSGENTDDLDDKDNFWAPIPENLLFERVLREAKIEPISNIPFMSNNLPKKNNTKQDGQDESEKSDDSVEKEDSAEQEKSKPFKEPHLGNIINLKI